MVSTRPKAHPGTIIPRLVGVLYELHATGRVIVARSVRFMIFHVLVMEAKNALVPEIVPSHDAKGD